MSRCSRAKRIRERPERALLRTPEQHIANLKRLMESGAHKALQANIEAIMERSINEAMWRGT